jgi:hypothetical protein
MVLAGLPHLQIAQQTAARFGLTAKEERVEYEMFFVSSSGRLLLEARSLE